MLINVQEEIKRYIDVFIDKLSRGEIGPRKKRVWFDAYRMQAESEGHKFVFSIFVHGTKQCNHSFTISHIFEGRTSQVIIDSNGAISSTTDEHGRFLKSIGPEVAARLALLEDKIPQRIWD